MRSRSVWFRTISEMASSRSWVLRAGNPAALVLVVGATQDRLATIADSIASSRYFLVAAEPTTVNTMMRSLLFSLVIVVADVPAATMASIERNIVRPPGKTEPIVVTGVDYDSIGGVIHTHIG